MFILLCWRLRKTLFFPDMLITLIQVTFLSSLHLPPPLLSVSSFPSRFFIVLPLPHIHFLRVLFIYCLNFADVQTVYLKRKGRGVVAKKALKFGTLIMASKAAAIAFAEDKTLAFRILEL